MSSNSAPAPISERLRALIERWAKAMDPAYPSAIVESDAGRVDDPALYGKERLRPQFIIDDDNNFSGGPK